MSYAAQCLLCQHAKRNTGIAKRVRNLPVPIGCGCLPEDASERSILNGILYQLAGERRCVAFQKLHMEPGSYCAVDLPVDHSKGAK